ncbi:Uncharacterised protein [Lysinibacillus sphaericus]|nr:Uncharacterised protein [Lysinibacillus sphaericus]
MLMVVREYLDGPLSLKSLVGIAESSYHYHLQRMKDGNYNWELEERIHFIFEENTDNYVCVQLYLELKSGKVSC